MSKKRKYRKKHNIKPPEPEEIPKEVLLSQATKKTCRDISYGTKRELRRIEKCEARTIEGLRKADQGAGSWRNDPAAQALLANLKEKRSTNLQAAKSRAFSFE